MGPTWKHHRANNSGGASRTRSHRGDEVSELVDAAIEPMYDDEEEFGRITTGHHVTNDEDTILLERQDHWRKLVFKLTMPTWEDVLQRGAPHVVAVNDRYIVSVGINDLIFMMTGTGDDDEFGLHKILTVVIAVVRETVGKVEGDKVMKHFGKFLLIIDAMFEENEGACLSLEVDHVMAQTKLKKPSINTTLNDKKSTTFQ